MDRDEKIGRIAQMVGCEPAVLRFADYSDDRLTKVFESVSRSEKRVDFMTASVIEIFGAMAVGSVIVPDKYKNWLYFLGAAAVCARTVMLLTDSRWLWDFKIRQDALDQIGKGDTLRKVTPSACDHDLGNDVTAIGREEKIAYVAKAVKCQPEVLRFANYSDEKLDKAFSAARCNQKLEASVTTPALFLAFGAMISNFAVPDKYKGWVALLSLVSGVVGLAGTLMETCHKNKWRNQIENDALMQIVNTSPHQRTSISSVTQP